MSAICKHVSFRASAASARQTSHSYVTIVKQSQSPALHFGPVRDPFDEGSAVASLGVCCLTSPVLRRSEDAGHGCSVVRSGRGGQRHVRV